MGSPIIWWIVRVAALLLALGIATIAPVRVFDCRADGGSASCRIDELRYGLVPDGSESVAGIAAVQAGPKWTEMQWFDDSGQVLRDLDDSLEVGTPMANAADAINGLTSAPAGTAWRGWQWPLPVALFVGALLLFAGLGAASSLLGWGRDLERPGADVSGSLMFGVGVLFCSVAALAFWIAPVVRYDCERDGEIVHCRITRLAAGVFVIQRLDTGPLASAESAARIQRIEQHDRALGDPNRTLLVENDSIKLVDGAGRIRFQHEDSYVVGTSMQDLKERLEALLGNGPDFDLWQGAWPPLLFGSLIVLILVPSFASAVLTALRRGVPALRPLLPGWLDWVVFLAVFGALALAWPLLWWGGPPEWLAPLL